MDGFFGPGNHCRLRSSGVGRLGGGSALVSPCNHEALQTLVGCRNLNNPPSSDHIGHPHQAATPADIKSLVGKPIHSA